MYEKIKLFTVIIFSIFFISCRTTKILSDNGTGNKEYRNTESEIRTGETELAISGSELKSTSEQIKQSGEQLEQSIRESTTIESEIGEILQRIRNRELTENQLVELGIEIPN